MAGYSPCYHQPLVPPASTCSTRRDLCVDPCERPNAGANRGLTLHREGHVNFSACAAGGSHRSELRTKHASCNGSARRVLKAPTTF